MGQFSLVLFFLLISIVDITYKSAPYSLSYLIFNSHNHKDSCTTYMNLYLSKSDFDLLRHIYLSIILKLPSPKIPQVDVSSISIHSKNARFTTPSFTKSLVLSFPFPSLSRSLSFTYIISIAS